MRLHRRLLLIVVALVGGAALALPVAFGLETSPTVEAVNVGVGIYGEHHWSPPATTIGVGGTVNITNPTEVKHGVEWVGGPAIPSCSGVPVGSTPTASATNWSGTCTFPAPGVYTFYCTVHGPAMTGRVTVNADGSTTVTSTTPPAAPGEPPTTSPPPTGETAPAPALGSSGQEGSPLVGGASHAIRLKAAPHGSGVRGSVAVSQAGAHGRLEVDLLAGRAVLASAQRLVEVGVGRFLRASLSAGATPFSVSLDRRARIALERRGRLPLTVRIVVTPPHGAAVTVLRRLVLHR